jgi:hypothetical protein
VTRICARYGVHTNDLGINDNLRQAGKVIAISAEIALSELELGSNQVAIIILENLTKWYDGGDI